MLWTFLLLTFVMLTDMENTETKAHGTVWPVSKDEQARVLGVAKQGSISPRGTQGSRQSCRHLHL